MSELNRIAREGDIVQITTNKGDIYTGTLLPSHFIIQNNGQISTEIYITQHRMYKSRRFGAVGLSVQDIKDIKLIKRR